MSNRCIRGSINDAVLAGPILVRYGWYRIGDDEA